MNLLTNNLHYMELSYFHFISRILIAILCGFCIGFERQWINRVAGIQTNILVCTGSCIFILSSYFVSYEGQSASRIGAQIVSGIGFLGAGMIFKDGITAHGINTAATIWCAAAIGILCGMGLIPYALLSTLCIVIANVVFRKLDHIVSRSRKWDDTRIVRNYEIQIIVKKEESEDIKKKALKIIHVADHRVYSVKTNFMKQDYLKITICFNTRNLAYQNIENITNEISALSQEHMVDWTILK